MIHPQRLEAFDIGSLQTIHWPSSFYATYSRQTRHPAALQRSGVILAIQIGTFLGLLPAQFAVQFPLIIRFDQTPDYLSQFHDHFLFSLQQALFELRQEDKKMTIAKRRMVRNAGRAIRRENVLASLFNYFSDMVADQHISRSHPVSGETRERRVALADRF